MTKQELNRDINRLYKTYKKLKEAKTNDEYFTAVEEVIKPEFIRLYDVDREFEWMNIKSIKILLQINLSQRFVDLHRFGMNIKIK